jgi:hypothetical protein
MAEQSAFLAVYRAKKRFNPHHEKENETNDSDEDRSVAQESARNRSLRAGWRREPAGAGKRQRSGRAELKER